MNELESYYNQSSNMGQTLGMIQRGEITQRVNALGAQEAKDDISEGLANEKEKVEEEGGGVGMGAGLLTKEGVAVAGKKVIKSATEKARGLIQSKVDELSEAKTGGFLGRIEGTGENLAQNALANAGAVANVPVIAPPVAGVGAGGGGVAGGGATGTAQPALGSGNANLNVDDDDLVDFDITNTLAGGVDRGAGGFVSKVKNFFKSNTSAENVVNDQVENAGAISSKTMADLGDKIGVDFGDLSKGDIGEALGNALGKGTLDAEKITSGLGIAGDAMEFLGPLGLVAGLGASIAGIFESKKVNNDLIAKQNDINTMTDNINGMGGMSFGSISNTALDTSQFRSGGSALNF
tara:strand:+ start:527 stop:1576 length:1050 start_codon:yes stop_codon:yes gene_type:complete